MCALIEDAFPGFFGGSEPIDLAGVRRWENEKIARNARAWHASGDLRTARGMALSFACECGRLGCGERVSATLEDFDRAPRTLASGHG